jgi:lipid-A-disaccharide synthase
MKYYIIAGEASGDLHASRLIRAIRHNDSQADFRAWGGDLMQEEGATIVKHYRDLAFMGFAEVISNLPTILGNMRFCKSDILQYQPDLVVFVDYPGFNIPMAKFSKGKGFKTAYYISPQVWAWKENRVKILRKVVDKMMVILPFEKNFYQRWNYPVDYVGHPLIEIIEDYKKNNDPAATRNNLQIEGDKKIIALLPGSRKQEILKKLPIMLEAATRFPEHVFVVGQAPGIADEMIAQFTGAFENIKVLKGDTYGLLSIADAALVTSGTATLETALFGVPEVVCYLGSPISYAIAKRIIKIKYISLVNLIMEKEVVAELIQYDLTADKIAVALERVLSDHKAIQQTKEDYLQLNELLKAGGRASEKAASIIDAMVK